MHSDEAITKKEFPIFPSIDTNLRRVSSKSRKDITQAWKSALHGRLSCLLQLWRSVVETIRPKKIATKCTLLLLATKARQPMIILLLRINYFYGGLAQPSRARNRRHSLGNQRR